MTHIVLVLLLLLASVSGGFAAPLPAPQVMPAVLTVPALPWATFSAAAYDAVYSTMGSCDGTYEVFAAYFEDKNKHRWAYYYDPETRRLVFMYYLPGTDTPVAYARSVVDPNKHDTIPRQDWEPYQPGVSSACAYLTGPRA
jgi:hypothetical protein